MLQIELHKNSIFHEFALSILIPKYFANIKKILPKKIRTR